MPFPVQERAQVGQGLGLGGAVVGQGEAGFVEEGGRVQLVGRRHAGRRRLEDLAFREEPREGLQDRGREKPGQFLLEQVVGEARRVLRRGVLRLDLVQGGGRGEDEPQERVVVLLVFPHRVEPVAQKVLQVLHGEAAPQCGLNLVQERQ